MGVVIVPNLAGSRSNRWGVRAFLRDQGCAAANEGDTVHLALILGTRYTAAAEGNALHQGRRAPHALRRHHL
jgi:hypothetical protein